MASNILFVFEGEKTEKKIADNFAKCFPNAKIGIQCAWCTTIYNLYNTITKDEDLDTFALLKENPKNKEALETYNRDDFAEIYLFFDYDGHTGQASDEKLIDSLNFFNEETEFGKLFISYPMVEALKHYSNTIDFKNLKIEAKKNINYKGIVNKECNEELVDFNHYNVTIWGKLIELHLKKMNYIINNDYSLPRNVIHQSDIFLKQLEKYINIDSTVAVLSSFPIFLFDYYGYNTITLLFEKNK